MAKPRNQQAGVWIKAVVLLLMLNTVGIAYIAYEVSRPTSDDAARADAEVAAAESELRMELWALSVAESVHRRLNGSYTTSLEALQLRPAEGIGVEVLSATRDRWTARATQAESGLECTADDSTPVLADEFVASCGREGGK